MIRRSAATKTAQSHSSQPAIERQREQSETNRTPQRDLLARTTLQAGGTGSPETHAAALNRVSGRRPARAEGALLQLQRQYGNRYVRRVVALAREQEDDGGAAPDVEEAIQGARGGGRPLPELLRTPLERSLGADLGGVRLHTGAQADALNQALGARAFTTGQDIFFKRGAYRPGSSGGRALLAHELTHVVQQSTGRVRGGGGGMAVRPADDAFEREAEAVARHAAHGSHEPGAQPTVTSEPNLIQRKISIEKHKTARERAQVHSFVDQLDKAVQKAHQYVLNVPYLAQYKDLDGHTRHWLATWTDYHKKGRADLINAAFGYAIESIATLVYMGSAPAGMQALLQQPRGNTRPDVVLSRESDGRDVAWLDITSDGPGTIGHILTAKTDWEKQDHYAEVTYPTLQAGDLVAMKTAPGRFDDQIDPQEFWRKRKFAEFLHDIRRQHWEKLGKEKFNEPRYTSGDRLIRDIWNKQEIKERLKNHFGIIFDDRMAASVLYAMNVGTGKFGLAASVSRTYGESLLLNFDPNLPTIPMPKETIPYPFPLSAQEKELTSRQQGPLSLVPRLTRVPRGLGSETFATRRPSSLALGTTFGSRSSLESTPLGLEGFQLPVGSMMTITPDQWQFESTIGDLFPDPRTLRDPMRVLGDFLQRLNRLGASMEISGGGQVFEFGGHTGVRPPDVFRALTARRRGRTGPRLLDDPSTAPRGSVLGKRQERPEWGWENVRNWRVKIRRRLPLLPPMMGWGSGGLMPPIPTMPSWGAHSGGSQGLVPFRQPLQLPNIGDPTQFGLAYTLDEFLAMLRRLQQERERKEGGE